MLISKKSVNYWIVEPFWGGIDYLAHYGLRSLPIDLASNIGSLLGKLSGKYRHPEKNDNIINSLKIINKTITASEYTGFCNEMWGNVGRVMAEMSFADKIGKDRFTVHNDHFLLNSKLGPTIFLYPHMGNWELVARIIQQYGFTLNVIFERLPNRFQRSLAETARKRHGYHQISSDYSGTRKLYEALKNGQSVGLAMDEFKFGQVQSPPFGRKKTVRTNIELAIKLSQRFNAPVIPGYCVRNNGVHFDFYLDTPLFPDTLKEQGVEASVAMFEKRCETWLCANMDQWYMLHRLYM